MRGLLCTSCGLKFSSRRAYVKHRNLRHPKETASDGASPQMDEEVCLIVDDDDNDDEGKTRHAHIDKIISDLNLQLIKEDTQNQLLMKKKKEEQARLQLEIAEKQMNIEKEREREETYTDIMEILMEDDFTDVTMTRETVKVEAKVDDDVTVLSVKPGNEVQGQTETKRRHRLGKRNRHQLYENKLALQQSLVIQQHHNVMRENKPAIQPNTPSFLQNYNATTQGNNVMMQDYNPLLQQNNLAVRNHIDMQHNFTTMQQNFPITDVNNTEMDQSNSAAQCITTTAQARECDPLQRSSHSIPTKYCEICRKTFLKRVDLLKHMKQCHKQSFYPIGIAGQYRCKICMQRFLNVRCLDKHMATYHSNVSHPGFSDLKPQDRNDGNVQQGAEVKWKHNQTQMTSSPSTSVVPTIHVQSSESLSDHVTIMNNAGLHYLNPNYVRDQKTEAAVNYGNSQSVLQKDAASNLSSIVKLDAKHHQDIAAYRTTPPQLQKDSYYLGQMQSNVNMTHTNNAEKGVANKSLFSGNVNRATNPYGNGAASGNNLHHGYQFPTRSYPESNKSNDISSEEGFNPNSGNSDGFTLSASLTSASLIPGSLQQIFQQDPNILGSFPEDFEMLDSDSVNNKLLEDFSNLALRPSGSFPMQQNHSVKYASVEGKSVHPSQMDVSYFNQNQDLNRSDYVEPKLQNTHLQSQQNMFALSHKNDFSKNSQGFDENKMRVVDYTNLASCAFQENGPVASQEQKPMQNRQSMSNNPMEILPTNRTGNNTPLLSHFEQNCPNEMTSLQSLAVAQSTSIQLKSIQLMELSNSPASSTEDDTLHVALSDDDREKPELKRTHKMAIAGEDREVKQLFKAKRQLFCQYSNVPPQIDARTIPDSLVHPQQNSKTANVEISNIIKRYVHEQKLQPPDLSNVEFPFIYNTKQELLRIETPKKPLQQNSGQILTANATKADELAKTSLVERIDNVYSSTHLPSNVTSKVSSAVTTQVIPGNEMTLGSSSTIEIATKNIVAQSDYTKNDASKLKRPAPQSSSGSQARRKYVESEMSQTAHLSSMNAAPQLTPSSVSSPVTSLPHPDQQYHTTLETMKQLSVHFANRTLPVRHDGTSPNLTTTPLTSHTQRTMESPCRPNLKRNSDVFKDGVQDDDTVPLAFKTSRTKAYVRNLRNKIFNQTQMMSCRSGSSVLKPFNDRVIYSDGQFSATSPNTPVTPTENIVLTHLFEEPPKSHATTARNHQMGPFLGIENTLSRPNSRHYINDGASFNYRAGVVNETDAMTTPQFLNRDTAQVNNMPPFLPSNMNKNIRYLESPFPSREIAQNKSFTPYVKATGNQMQQESLTPPCYPNRKLLETCNMPKCFPTTMIKSSLPANLPDVTAMGTTQFRTPNHHLYYPPPHAPSYVNLTSDPSCEHRPHRPPPLSYPDIEDHRPPNVTHFEPPTPPPPCTTSTTNVLGRPMAHAGFRSPQRHHKVSFKSSHSEPQGRQTQPGKRPVSYALPHDVNREQFTMQEFLLEHQPETMGGVELVSSIAYLPVKKRATGRVTLPITLIPND